MQSVHKMQPLAINGVVWSVCLLDMFVSCANTAELIEMPIGG